jgi:succinate-acetate transporter protein
MSEIQNNVLNITINIIGIFLFMYVVYQILIYMGVSTIYVKEYVLLYISLIILYIILPKGSVSWK